ncbi:hypothetical protein V8C86DRAFT_2766426 [Haematococcus lacustris]
MRTLLLAESTLQMWVKPKAVQCFLDLLIATEKLMEALIVKCYAFPLLPSSRPGPSKHSDSPELHCEDWINTWLRGPLRLLVLSVHVLQDPAIVGPAGLEARPAAWLSPGHQLIKGWCDQLVAKACQLAALMKNAGIRRVMFITHVELDALSSLVMEHAPMQSDAERALALVIITLGISFPLLAMLEAEGKLPCLEDASAHSLAELHSQLSAMPEHQVQGWRALAAGTHVEALLNEALAAAALQLQLPHLTAVDTRETAVAAAGGVIEEFGQDPLARRRLVELMASLRQREVQLPSWLVASWQGC